ncbi:MAG: PAS domain S-box protein [Deltaproteobacteria bacterium]|nr:PAS domain S-box protein [Deltaproteobacteria bacterium]
MKRIDNLPVRNKLYLVFGVIALFLLSFVAISAYTVTRLDSTLGADSVYLSFKDRLGKLKTDLISARKEVLSILLGLSLEGHDDGYIKDFHVYAAEVDGDLMEILRDSTDGESDEMIKDIARIWGEIKLVREEELMPAALSGGKEKAVRIAMESQRNRYDEALKKIDALARHAMARREAAKESLRGTFKKIVTLYVLATVIALGVSLSVILYISRGLGRRFASLIDSIDRFDYGKKEAQIEVYGDDEIGRLAGCLRRLFADIYESGIAHEQYMNIIKWESAQHQKKAEDLKKSEERFRGLVETTNDWVWEVDRDCRYTYASPKVRDILGYAPEDLIGKTPFDFMLPDEAGRVRALCASITASRMPFNNMENANLRKDGSIVVIETSGTPFFDHWRGLLGYRGIGRDITGRKGAEEERSRIQVQLVQSDKMASIGQLAAGVAHEINNPVGYVGSNLNALSDHVSALLSLNSHYENALKAALEEREDDFLLHAEAVEAFKKKEDIGFVARDIESIIGESKDGLDRIKAIVKGLKDFSYAPEGELALSDINGCIDDALRLAWHEIKHKAELVRDFSEVPKVHCRPWRLTQVFLNIILNAAQAMEARGSIWVKTEESAGKVRVTIRDNGPGMAEEVKSKVFDPFFTTKPPGSGTGLGLAIALGIISEHKGTIELESAPGMGTTFYITLPLRDEALAA